MQDYHFALLPRMLKNARPDLVVCQFWHIPWPNREVFRVCPWQDEILDGLLGNDLLAFHIQYHCNNFLDTVDRTLEAASTGSTSPCTAAVTATYVRPYPISIDPGLWASVAPGRDWTRDVAATRKRLRVGDAKLVMGVDRVDYTKGIPERFQAVDRLLERCTRSGGSGRVPADRRAQPRPHPGYRPQRRSEGAGRSRSTGVTATETWTPIIFRQRALTSPRTSAPLYRIADGCVVSSSCTTA